MWSCWTTDRKGDGLDWLYSFTTNLQLNKKVKLVDKIGSLPKRDVLVNVVRSDATGFELKNSEVGFSLIVNFGTKANCLPPNECYQTTFNGNRMVCAIGK